MNSVLQLSLASGGTQLWFIFSVWEFQTSENSIDLQKPRRRLHEQNLHNNTLFERRKTNFKENSDTGTLVIFILEMTMSK